MQEAKFTSFLSTKIKVVSLDTGIKTVPLWLPALITTQLKNVISCRAHLYFGASSYNFFNKGLPYKILMFLSSVLILLSNDITFVDKNRCGN